MVGVAKSRAQVGMAGSLVVDALKYSNMCKLLFLSMMSYVALAYTICAVLLLL